MTDDSDRLWRVVGGLETAVKQMDRVAGSVTALSADLAEIKGAIEEIKGFGKRLSAMEKMYWMRAGAATVISAIFGSVVGFFAQLLTRHHP